MEKDQLSRQLAVILHADVVGSTSLVQRDEALAHKRIRATFNNFSKTIGAFGGVTHEIRGDALIAQFERASDAVSAAVTFQNIIKDFNLNLEDQIRPELRIGISLGEVIVADNTITGEGVVLAQRLEQIAEPGSVVVQGSVSETVPTRIPFEFKNLGKQTLKGFDQPVRAFAANIRPGEEIPVPEKNRSLKIIESGESKDSVMLPPESYETLIGERLELPNTPSIAVLPFQNMSSDPEQEFFADGMSEDIITSLSRMPRLFVIARNSTFVYKNRAVDVRQIGRDLAVSHVLEGSVRGAGDRIRITAQLVETQNGNHVWAESYDRTLDDIFAVQDEITRNIVIEMSANLGAADLGTSFSTGATNLKAWELTIKAGDLLDMDVKENIANARQLLERALEYDDKYTPARIELAWSYFEEYIISWNLASEQLWQKAFDITERAIEIDPSNPHGYSLLGQLYMSSGDLDQALVMSNKSVELGPGDSYVLAFRGDILNEMGRYDEGIASVRNAIRRCPYPPAWFLFILGIGLHLNSENALALSAIEQSLEREPGAFIPLIWLASILTVTGREDDAKEITKRVIIREPEFSTAVWISKLSPKSRSRIKDNLLAAGFPE